MSRVGETIAGKYRVLARIGAGGMGEIYAARHLQLGTPLALKFLADASRHNVERFLREAKACAALRSEHVCRVTDYGVDGETPYIAMELLEGEDLASSLRAGRLPVATAVDYVIQACMGIAEAHSLNIVHRDLKPGNLFLTKRPDGSPLIKVLDFGVAKVPVDSDVSLTQTASVIGSPAYMSPEQVRSSRSVDGRSDIWALAVILYELVSDRHPFEGKSLTDLAVAIAMDPPTPLVEAPELESVILRALDKDPNRRYVDVAAFAGALERFTHKHGDSSEVASRILYGDAEHPTLPMVAAAPDDDDTAAPTVPDLAPTPATTTTTTATTEVASSHRVVTSEAPRSRARTRWRISLGLAGLLVAGGVAATLARRSADADPDPPTVPTIAAPTPPPAPPPVVPPPASAEQVSKGRVIVTVTGVDDAAILIDGSERGHGTHLVDELEAGAHAIEIRVAGRAPIEQPVDILPGMVNTVAIVVPAGPTAKPTIAVATRGPARRRGSPRPAKPEPDPAPPLDDDDGNEVLELEPRFTCKVTERLPSGGCPKSALPPDKLYRGAFDKTIQGVWSSIERCKGTGPATTGRIVLLISVDPNGRADATVRRTFDDGIGACVAATIETARFPVTRQGGSIRYRIDL